MTTPARLVQIGVGGWGQHWCRQVIPRLRTLGLAEVVGAVDLSAAALSRAAEQLTLPPSALYTDAARALADLRPDFVTIVVPPAHHEAMVNLAVAHGCHILSEKPIADTMAASARIARRVHGAGLKMAVTMSHRFDQDKQTLQRLIRSGQYGRLDYLVGRNTWTCRAHGQWGDFRYEIPDPLLIEGTVHHFDIMRALANSNARTVHAATWNPPWSDFKGDAQGLILVEMENGVHVVYEGAKANATQLNGWTMDYWRAECEQATLELDNRRLRVRSQLAAPPADTEVPLDQQDAWMNPWLAELFVRWIQGGPPPPNTLADNLQCTALLFAAIESAHSRSIVSVQDFLQSHLDAPA